MGVSFKETVQGGEPNNIISFPVSQNMVLMSKNMACCQDLLVTLPNVDSSQHMATIFKTVKTVIAELLPDQVFLALEKFKIFHEHNPRFETEHMGKFKNMLRMFSVSPYENETEHESFGSVINIVQTLKMASVWQLFSAVKQCLSFMEIQFSFLLFHLRSLRRHSSYRAAKIMLHLFQTLQFGNTNNTLKLVV